MTAEAVLPQITKAMNAQSTHTWREQGASLLVNMLTIVQSVSGMRPWRVEPQSVTCGWHSFGAVLRAFRAVVADLRGCFPVRTVKYFPFVRDLDGTAHVI